MYCDKVEQKETISELSYQCLVYFINDINVLTLYRVQIFLIRIFNMKICLWEFSNLMQRLEIFQCFILVQILVHLYVVHYG